MLSSTLYMDARRQPESGVLLCGSGELPKSSGCHSSRPAEWRRWPTHTSPQIVHRLRGTSPASKTATRAQNAYPNKALQAHSLLSSHHPLMVPESCVDDMTIAAQTLAEMRSEPNPLHTSSANWDCHPANSLRKSHQTMSLAPSTFATGHLLKRLIRLAERMHRSH